MKSISLFKLLTLVCFLIVGFQFEAKAETQEECKLACNRKAKTSCASETGDKYSGCVAKAQDTCEATSACESKDSKSDLRDMEVKCRDMLNKYDEAAKKTKEECARMGEDNAAKCVAKSKSCANGLNAFAEPGSDGEDSIGNALVNLIGVYSQMQGATGANGQSVAGCVIENNDSERDREERMDEKITQLRQDISKLRNEDPAEEDQKLNEKRQEVEEKMLDARKEVEKAQTDAKTKNQEDAGRLAEKILKTNAEKRNRLNNIASLNDRVADKALEVQQTVLMMADALVQKQCKDSTREYRDKKLADKAKTGKKFSKAEDSAFSAELQELEGTCLKAQAMEKQKKINAINNEKRAIQREIANLQAKNSDDATSMANDQKQIEALKTIASEQEKKDLENLTTKLTNLNKSVTDMETTVAARKKAFEEKAKAKEDQINKILQDRQNVKSKFAKVYSTASSNSSSASTFVGQCCKSDYTGSGADKTRSTVKGFDEACSRIRSDYAIKDSKPSTTKSGK